MIIRQHSNTRLLLSLVATIAMYFATGAAHAEKSGKSAHENPMQNYGERHPRATTPRGLDIAELKRRRNMVRDYLTRQRAQLDIVTTTVTDSGQVIDWIRPESQIASGNLASPPPQPERPHMPDVEHDNVIPSVGELVRQQHARGPAGTVPVVRRDIDEVINAMMPPEHLQDFLSKSGNTQNPANVNSIPNPGDSAHIYAHTSQYIDNLGADGLINVWNPYVQPVSEEIAYWGEFSLGQVAVVNENGTADEKETIEAGWQDFPAFYGDNYPHLFIYYTTNGYTEKGDNLGGYNRDVKGWVQYSRTTFPGMRLTSTSTYDGTQAELRIIVKYYYGNWWLYANNEWIGYYPGSLFRSDGLRSEANKVSWYGEVVDADDGYATYTDMGSGSHAAAGFRKAAYMRNLKYFEVNRGLARDYKGTPFVSDSQCYSLSTWHVSGSSWGSYHFWGGPGRINRYSTGCGGFTFVRRY